MQAVGADVIVAPIMKVIAAFKFALIDPFVAYALKMLVAGKSLVVGFSGVIISGVKNVILLTGIHHLFGEAKVWIFKKSGRLVTRFFLTQAAKRVFIAFIGTLFRGVERKILRQLPLVVQSYIRQIHIVDRSIKWWSRAGERAKRLVYGLILCVILVLFGHYKLGIYILLFDLVWEVVLKAFSVIAWAWRLILPVILHFVPNALIVAMGKVSEFITRVMVPYVIHDARVYYGRLLLRIVKARMYKYFRKRKNPVRVYATKIIPTIVQEKWRAYIASSKKN